MNTNSIVSVIKVPPIYPAKGVHRPSKKYPEYRFEEISCTENSVYEGVRESIHLLGLDEKNYGTPDWNPFGELIQPGMTVLIKPNMVMDKNANLNGGLLCLYTQPSVVAPVIDYILLAMNNNGKIIIGDAPMQECDFDSLVHESGYDQLISYYQHKNIDIELVDFRELTSVVKGGIHYSKINENASGHVVDLKDQSEFSQLSDNEKEKMRITNYDPRELLKHHTSTKNEYYISDYILDADVIINMPKPKSHRKAGVTISLKNFVGANVRKEYLPHHTMGSCDEHGDEYEKKSYIHSLRSKIDDKLNLNIAEKKYFKAKIFLIAGKMCSILLKIKKHEYYEGSWYGNNTISKTIVDLNKIVKYANKDGVLCDEPQRRILNIADCIIAGEKEGPVAPSPKKAGMIVSGFDQLQFDETVCTLMGFDKTKIPTFLCVRKSNGKYKVWEDKPVVIRSNDCMYNHKSPEELPKEALCHFVPTNGWKDHIEIEY